ncbi:hypothetical protein DKZ27_09300 [Limosilactobacillus reuteri]|uniref:hypothetical protein n=1 Tax=Limosilactobacillus reuteri TaxID=1598 RepID=UPI000D6FA8AE|nr:hypothetical protein [Limosilactobacillus reuteri]PWT29930.1 hypothetical protein DKZ27_09300 [Limosilactobacillus reuteri]
MLVWSVIWLILDRMHDYTKWLDGISNYLFIIYILGILLIYILGTIANESKLYSQIQDLKQKHEGLLGQHNIDMKDKEKLSNQIDLEKLFIRILSEKMAQDDMLEAKAQFDLLKELSEIEKNESGKDN